MKKMYGFDRQLNTISFPYLSEHLNSEKKSATLSNQRAAVLNLRAIDGTRTRGLDLGKVARYQLRHYRIYDVLCFVFVSLKHNSYITP